MPATLAGMGQTETEPINDRADVGPPAHKEHLVSASATGSGAESPRSRTGNRQPLWVPGPDVTSVRVLSACPDVRGHIKSWRRENTRGKRTITCQSLMVPCSDHLTSITREIFTTCTRYLKTSSHDNRVSSKNIQSC